MSNPNTTPSEEIDLGQLFQKIGGYIKASGLGFLRFLAQLRRIPMENKASFTGIIITSVVLSIVYSMLLKKSYYESTMILNTQYLNKRLVDNSIDNLDNLADEKSSTGLARVLHIHDTLADNILSFSTRPFVSEEEILQLEILKQQFKNAGEDVDEELVDNVVGKIEIENRHSFEITVRALKATVIPDLQNAIVDHFRSNEYVKRRIEITRSNLEARKAMLENEMHNLDSLKVEILANYRSMAIKERDGSNNVILSERAITNPVEIYKENIRLYNDLQAVKRQLYVQPDFEIVDGFTEFTEPSSPSTPKLAVLALFLGLLVAYLDVAARRFNKYLANLDTE